MKWFNYIRHFLRPAKRINLCCTCLTKTFFLMMCFSLFFSASLTFAQETPVKMWEGTIDIPTYLLDDPEVAPIFERDWSYQRARRSVYPYLLNDNMTRNKEVITYKALYLENEYLKLCVLPEIGGRLFYATDKTNDYEILYRNDVIKPANVGMLGAWISGGAEWNAFHHHRNTTNLPVNYKLIDNEDGSMTIWVGETELRHRMSWAIGVTLFPGKSYMEITGRLINATHNDIPMLYWSNAATHVDENYQIIFPQSVEFGTFHCKNSFCHWPITKEPYNGYEEYANGIDASWWKNHFMSNSIFVHDLQEDFIAGYDHARKAGTMMTANHHIVKGAKFWLWGPNSEWDTKILTDNSGHYIELMVGAYSDNQPDYTWAAPHEVKTFSHHWYGLRELGGVKTGNKHAALNLDLDESGKAFLGVNTTEKMKDLTVKLTSRDGTVLFSETAFIAPESPFVREIKLDKSVKDADLTMTVEDKEGNLLLTYTPIEKDDDADDKPLPEIVDRPLLPHQIENTEECYYVGLRNLQFYNPFIDPTDYFEEVLRRDPGDVRSNTRMGVYWRQRGDYEKAANYLRTAIKRQTKDYTRPRDCEALYNLGLILKTQGKLEAAIDTLYRAVWDYTYNSSGNYQLAQIYSWQGNFDMALDRLDESITYYSNNFNSLNLKATIMRLSGNKEEALKCVERVLSVDPLNAYASHEKMLLAGDDYFYKLMRDDVQSYIELALSYMHNGFIETSFELLTYIDGKVEFPIVKMWLGEMAEVMGDHATADKYFKAALALPTEYCHPFRLETLEVLRKLKERYPDNYKVYYYLGNLLYDKQPDNAMKEWEKCIEINPDFAMAWRNLGWAHWLHTKNYAESVRYYRKAIELDPTKALFLEEIVQVYERKGENVQVRYDLLKSHHELATKRYLPLATEVMMGTFLGDYDYVLHLLRTCYFPTREGVASFHDVYVDALVLAAKEKDEQGQKQEAIKLYEESFEFPENHQVFLVDKRLPRDAQVYFLIGDTYERMGNKSKARSYYKRASEVNVKKTDYRFWQGLALEKLGKKEEAKTIFNTLLEEGRGRIVESYVNFYGAEGTTGKTVETINSLAYYTMGLGELGLGNVSAAEKYFAKSLELKPDNLWASVMLKEVRKSK